MTKKVEAEPTQKAFSASDFFTKEAADEGRKMFISLPDGEVTEHWLMVLGVDSDKFRAEEMRAKRKMVEISRIEDQEAQWKEIEELHTRSIAALVVGWSFDDLEFNDKNLMHFLRNAPQIAEQVNKFAANRAAFFKRESKTFSGGQSKK